MENSKKVFFWNEKTDKADLSQYTHIRAFHACRTSNIKSYMEEGIHKFNRPQAYKIVHDILIQCDIKEEVILNCFEEHFNNKIHHFNKICVNISKKELLNFSGHYLIYGSEFICGIAAELVCQHKLKKIGIPTLIECYIDKRKFSDEVLEYIENNEMKYGCWDGGIYLLDDISPDEIAEVTYPRKIFDPLLGRNYIF